MRTMGRGRAAWAACAVMAAVFSAVPAVASAQERAGSFSCRGTALRVFTSEIVTANPGDTPCRTQHKAAVNTFVPLGTLGFVDVEGLAASTKSNPDPIESRGPFRGDGAGALGGVLGVRIKIGKLFIRAAALRTRTVVWCDAPPNPPRFQSVDEDSDAVLLEINGRRVVDFDRPTTIPAGPVTIYFNRQIETPNSLTQRALEIDLNGNPIVVAGESTVDYSGNPCTTTG